MELSLNHQQRMRLKNLFQAEVKRVMTYRDLKQRHCLEITVQNYDRIIPEDHALYPQVMQIFYQTT